MALVKYDGKMDPECIALCDAINSLDGLRTIESCCGHDEHPFRIFLNADNVQALAPLVYYLDRCHSGIRGWSCIAYTDCSGRDVWFRVESESKGEVAYKEAEKIAGLFREE